MTLHNALVNGTRKEREFIRNLVEWEPAHVLSLQGFSVFDGVPRAGSNSATSSRADQELPKKNFCRNGVGKLSLACCWGCHCRTPRVCGLSELMKRKM